jgi:hypothetical protein
LRTAEKKRDEDIEIVYLRRLGTVMKVEPLSIGGGR